MSINLKERFDEAANWANVVETHAEHQKRADLEYARSDMNTDTGRISLGQDDENNSKLHRADKKKERDRKFQEILDKALDALFDDMDNWSADNFKDFNSEYVAKLREKADKAYENSDYATYTALIHAADDYEERADAIWNDPNLTEEEKKAANKELIEEQDPSVVNEVAKEMYKEGKLHRSPQAEVVIQQNDKIVENQRAEVEQASSFIDTSANSVAGFNPLG